MSFPQEVVNRVYCIQKQCHGSGLLYMDVVMLWILPDAILIFICQLFVYPGSNVVMSADSMYYSLLLSLAAILIKNCLKMSVTPGDFVSWPYLLLWNIE